MSKVLIVSASLNDGSNSRILARELEAKWSGSNVETTFLDLRDADLPICDGGAAYGDERVGKAKELVEAADAYVFATPIYVYNVNSALKNFVELVGRAMEDKLVGFLCAAGGRMSYMSVMNFANTLMLDFRTLVLPRFVYAASEDFEDGKPNETIDRRIDQFATAFAELATKLKG